MAVKTSLYGSQISQDVSRGPSNGIWFDCPLGDFVQSGGGGPTPGTHFYDDFQQAGNLSTTNAIGNMGQYATWADTACVLGTDPAQEGGVVLLSDAGNITLNITLGSSAGWARLASGATGFPLQGKLWFECRVAVGSITTAKRDVFVGLMDNTNFTTASAAKVIAGSNALATINNCLGFHFRATTNPTDVGVAFNVAGGTVQYPTNLQTLVNTVTGTPLTPYAAVTNGQATGFVKLGFVFDPTAGNAARLISSASSGQTAAQTFKPLIQFFVNGQAAPAFLTSTNVQASTFPTGYMAPTLSYTSRAATASGGVYIDWWRCAQLGTY